MVEQTYQASFSRAVRLLSKREYQQVFKNPIRSSDPYFTILAVSNKQGLARLGLAIAKKAVSKSTQRNRIKRMIRESFRHQQFIMGEIDIVVLAKRGLEMASNEDMRQSLSKHWSYLVKKCAKS